MAQGELDITALADGLDAPKRFLLPCRLSAMGREYCRRWFVNNPKHPEQDQYALVVAETEDEAPQVGTSPIRVRACDGRPVGVPGHGRRPPVPRGAAGQAGSWFPRLALAQENVLTYGYLEV